MPNLVPALVFVALSATALGQGTSPLPTVVKCVLGSNCSSRFVQGRRVLTLKDDSISVSADLIAQKRFTRASVSILNSSLATIDVVPATFQLTVGQGQRTYNALTLPAVLKTERRRDATWGNFFDMGPAATKQETVVTRTAKDVDAVTGISPAAGKADIRVTEITVPDEEARAVARTRIEGRKQLLAQDCAKMEESYLRASTVNPGDSTEGLVYFAPVHPGEPVSLSVVAGTHRYVFLTSADAEE